MSPLARDVLAELAKADLSLNAPALWWGFARGALDEQRLGGALDLLRDHGLAFGRTARLLSERAEAARLDDADDFDCLNAIAREVLDLTQGGDSSIPAAGLPLEVTDARALVLTLDHDLQHSLDRLSDLSAAELEQLAADIDTRNALAFGRAGWPWTFIDEQAAVVARLDKLKSDPMKEVPCVECA